MRRYLRACASAEGSEYEWELLMVGRADDQGRYLRLEYFPEGEWAAALEQFDEWSDGAADPS